MYTCLHNGELKK